MCSKRNISIYNPNTIFKKIYIIWSLIVDSLTIYRKPYSFCYFRSSFLIRNISITRVYIFFSRICKC